ncbi:MAG: succinate dehydrogenase, hydrophobic membrane anchor protein [Pseudomonadota bacterium]
MSMTTPLKRVRKLGSAKEGADHFWKQRVTAASNAVLAIGLVALIAYLAGSDHATASAALANPFVALMLLALVVSGTVHMRLGMQVVIEDYVHAEGLKVVLLVANTFFAVGIALACVYAVLKLSFGA